MISTNYFRSNNIGLKLSLDIDCLTSKITSLFQRTREGSQLAQNIHLADEAIRYTRSHVLFSSTFPNQFGALFQHTEDRTEKVLKLSRTINEIRENINVDINTLPADLRHEFSRAIIAAKLAKKYSIGNCYEQAAVAFHYLLKKHVPTVRLSKIEEGDHVFVILGEGKEGVVIDPWLQMSYPLSEIESHLHDYQYVDPETHAPVIAPIDLTTQKISIIATNILSAEEFTMYENERDQKIKRLLTAFHEQTDRGEKIKIGVEIASLILSVEEDEWTANDQLLLSQVSIFLDPNSFNKLFNQLIKN